MRLLVTGVLGFAGRHLVPAARARGHEVFGSGLEETPDAALGADLAGYRRADVRQLAETDLLFEAFDPEMVIHLAGQASGGRAFADPVQTFEVNAGGTLHVLEAARRRRFGGPLLVVTSSEAYGRITIGRPVDESSPLRPASPYGASKAAADTLAQMYYRTYGVNALRARSFSHSGPGQGTDFVAPAWAEQIAEAEARAEGGDKGPFVIRVGNLDPVRELGDVRDTVEAYLDLVERGQAGEAYNVCTGQAVKLRDLFEALKRLAAVTIASEVDPERVRAVDIPYLVGDNKKLRRELGWAPRRSLDETLEGLLGYYRAARGVARAAGERK